VSTKTTGMYRVDCYVGESNWASNAVRFNTVEEAEIYALDLYSRWMPMKGYRIVPSNHPQRELVDFEASADAGFVSRDLS
jgi:hypothetical protein